MPSLRLRDRLPDRLSDRLSDRLPASEQTTSRAGAVVAGAIVGIAASIAAGAALAAILPEVRGAAWVVAALCGSGLVTVGASAALLAARGVISIEPLRALRAD